MIDTSNQGRPVRRIETNRRTAFIAFTSISALILITVAIAGAVMPESAYAPSFADKNQGPSFAHPFGTDWAGRDMFLRCIKGLSTSIQVGIFAALGSCLIALVLGVAAATMGRKVDRAIGFVIDMVMGIPNIILILLICFALGKGTFGVLVGIALTHWPKVARVVRAEVKQVKSRPYVLLALKMGKSRWSVAKDHLFPQIMPQLVIAFVLLFPHAIMHEASMTFLGFGIPAEQPAIGIILSESMRYLISDMWWLTVMPGLSLITIVLLFEAVGENIRALSDPRNAHA